MKFQVTVSAAVFWAIFSVFFYCQTKDGISVTVKKGQTIRDLAKEYLNDADLWDEILKLNNLKQITDVKPGMTLFIPSTAVAAADKELGNAQKKIQEATALGAKLFAPAIIAEAIKFREEALSKKKKRDWSGAVQSALKSIEFSNKAIDESKKKNNVEIQAVLSQKLGNVQGRGSNDLIWLDTPLKSQLSEGQKVRTLSQSFAEISFKDASKLVMNANSQAIIQKMRKSVLENKQESKVSLVEGDIYALLSGNKKKKMSVDINGVEAKINADRFWFNKTGNNLKVASYGGSIELYQDGKTIIIGENKGTIIGTNTASKSEDSELLTAPSLKTPLQNTTIFKSDIKNEVTFSWEPIQGAQRYWLEIANENSSFTDLIFSQDNLGSNEFKIFDVKNDGVYYWRITPIDKDGFPGQRSLPRVFKVITDNSAPYLSVFSPAPGEILKNEQIEIIGETENFVELSVNGEKTSVDSSGKFSKKFRLQPGANKIVFSLKDLAANTDTVIRTFYFAPRKTPKLIFDRGFSDNTSSQFLTNVTQFHLSGQTDSLSEVTISDNQGVVISRTMSDSLSGRFGLLIPVSPGENKLRISVLTRLGDSLTQKFSIVCDLTPPVVELLEPLPPVSVENSIQIKVKIEDAEKVFLNGTLQKFSGNQLTESVKLERGYNVLSISAEDKAGNKKTIEKVILYDNFFPEKVSVNYLPLNAAANSFFEVTVSVDRLSHETSRTARYEYAVGNQTYNGVLRYSDITGKYSDSFFFPPDYGGKIRITKIIFQNSNGITKDFTFNQ